MKLNIIVDDQSKTIEIPQEILNDAEVFFQKMDRDMDRGWQMSREFIEKPDQTQRCQIAADRLLGSLNTGNTPMTMLMAGYILKRLPGVTAVDIDTHGDILQTEIIFGGPPPTPPPASTDENDRANNGGRMPKMQALDQAGKEVSKIYKVGHSWRYAVLERGSGKWIESAPIDNEKEAEAHRMQAFKQRFDELASR